MSSSTESTTYLNLLAGDQQDLVSEAETLDLGQDLAAADAVGKILRAIGVAAADTGNTGEGDISGEALGAHSKIGTYTATCTAIGAPAVFAVVDPDGERLADAVAEVAYDGPIAFLIEAYGVAFAVGDIFTVIVGAGSLEVTALDSTAVDGSEDIYGVLAEDCDASLAATPCTVYTKGEFNRDVVGFTGTDTYATYQAEARKIGIIFRDTVSAA